MINRILDILATRLGVGLSIFLVITLAVGGETYVRYGVNNAKLARELFELPRMREGFVAQADINRILYIANQANKAGAMTPELERRFVNALDVLFVRRGSFSRIVNVDPSPALGQEATKAIDAVIARSDAAIASGFDDLEGLSEGLISDAEKSRARITFFIDQKRREQRDVLLLQANTLETLSFVLAAVLSTIAILAGAAILLLRREVLARRTREQAENRANYLSRFDPMTGLPNREALNCRIREMSVNEDGYSFLLIDIDDFKGVNDSYGQQTGDCVLVEVARRLESRVLPYGGFIARLGSDEFAALFPTGDENRLRFYCEEIFEDMRRHVIADTTWLSVDISIGGASSETTASVLDASASSMKRAADLALMVAKSDGGNRYQMFNAEIEACHTERRAWLRDIPKGLENGEFFPCFQPKVHLKGGKLYGFEALIRWNHEGKTVSPGVFLPLAEESRLIIDLDLYILSAACHQLVLWNAEKLAAAPLSVSVNLSALHFESTTIVGQVEAALQASGLPPHLLTLELTETVLVEDWETVTEILSGLRGLGVRISLDDFGTGYSSLAYLRQIAADELKIDRSFVTEIENSEQTRFILDAVIDIAKGLDMSIVVEGIETEAQARIVRSFGCDQGQGYLFGAPMPAAEIEQTLLIGASQPKSA